MVVGEGFLLSLATYYWKTILSSGASSTGWVAPLWIFQLLSLTLYDKLLAASLARLAGAFKPWLPSTIVVAPSRHAETVFGWNRHAVASGIKEAELGVPIWRDVETRGSCLVEVANPELANHVDRLCGNDAQVDPKFQTVTLYTRMTGESLRAALAESLSIPVESLPVPRTWSLTIVPLPT